MISALELRQQLAFALDAEGSDHYRDDLDYTPAINASIKWLTAVAGSAFGENKIGEEFFREISYSGVFQTDEHSRITLSVFPNEVWTVLAIYPQPVTKSIGNAPVIVETESYFRDDLVHVSSVKDCVRKSIEEWARAKENPLEAGYDGNNICDGLKTFAYLNPFNYRNVNSGSHSQELEIRPKPALNLATVFWAKKPTLITNILTDNIEFPSSCFQLLFDKALYYIGYKIGDSTTIASISNQDISQLMSVI
jgi:hypothetical protein